MDPRKVVHKNECFSNIQPLLKDNANKKTMYVENLHEAHLNAHGPFGDVYGLPKN